MGTHRFALVVALVLGACGDDSGSARMDSGGGADGSGSDLFNTIPCDYVESMDTTNFMPSTSEPTTKSLGAARLVMCGKFDTGHYGMNGTMAPPDLADADGFLFNVTTAGPVIVHLIADNNLSMTTRSIVYISKGNTLYGLGVIEGDHATFTHDLPMGTDYVIGVYTIHSAALASAINYKVLVSPDTARCAKKTGTADHAEGADGGANDVVDYNFTSNSQSSLSAATTDNAEDTMLLVDPSSTFLFTGDLANVDPADDYMDRDTFQFATGPTTTQMSVRLNWTSTTADNDFRIYPPKLSGSIASFAGGVDASDMEDEYETFAVQPNTLYWLWVAASDGASPGAYAATLCGETFTP